MTVIDKLKTAGLPVIESESNESENRFTFSEMTPEQHETMLLILSPRPTTLYTDSNVMIGDGVDTINLTVTGEPNTSVIVSVMAGSTPSMITVPLDYLGVGTQPFSCETTPTKIIFSCNGAECQVRSL